MTCFICRTCGTQHTDSATPPHECRICVDDRQYVDWAGQAWTTHDELQASHHARLETDVDLLGIGVAPAFAIPQRALHVPTDAGNILWETTSLVTPEALAELRRRGGVDLIIISHPHFYASMIEWSDALGDVPVLLNEADRDWISRPSPRITSWAGDVHRLSPAVTLYRCPGHFPGSTVLHWSDGPNGKNILLAGDALHPAQDRRHVSFMYSVPNRIPAHPDNVEQTQQRLAHLDIDDLYGFTWGLNIIGDARASIDRSFDRYYQAIGQPARTTR